MKNGFILLAISLLVLNACQTGDTDGPSLATPWLGGSDAMLIDFIENEPPASILDKGEEEFTVTVKVKNNGEDYVPREEIEFRLKGVPASDLTSSNNRVDQEDLTIEPDFDIEPRRKNPDTGNAIESPTEFVTFGPFVYNRDLAGNTERKFFVEACYMYDTYATADICIKENLRDTEDDKVCKISGARTVANSGAPVQITTLEEFGSGADAIRFSFTIAPASNSGFIYGLGTGCNDIPQNEERVRVHVNVDGFDGLTCTGLTDLDSNSDWEVIGTKNIQGGGQEVNCKLEIDENDRFDGVVNVQFQISYDYSQTIKRSVILKSYDDFDS